ncbi:Flp1 family type IVb pilin [Faecalimonas umbilicata]|nr:Flp1 family type IVb pilin [Faecalimonas umbilicata]
MRATRQGANFIVVLIGLVIIFKSQLTSLVNSIFQKITSESSGI